MFNNVPNLLHTSYHLAHLLNIINTEILQHVTEEYLMPSKGVQYIERNLYTPGFLRVYLLCD